jgi:tetratricopeptide (TPR) repeat protein
MTEAHQTVTDTVFRNTGDKLDTAQLYHRAGDLMKAEDLYREILQEDPTNPDAYHLLGLIGLQAGKYPIARELIQLAVDLDEAKAVYHANLAAAWYGQREYEKAEVEYRRAVELDPDYDEAYLNLGIVLKHQEKFEEAIEPLDNAVKIRPRDPKPFALLAECLIRIGDEEQADSIARAAAKLGPKDIETLGALINALDGLNRPREAIPWAKHLVARQPTKAAHHFRLAGLAQEAGLSTMAQESARRGFHLDPHTPRAYKILSQTLMSSTEWDEALETVNKGLEKFPEDVELITQKAGILERKGRIKESYKLIRPIIAYHKHYPLQTLNVFTSIARKFGAEQEAARMLTRALSRTDLPDGVRQGLDFQAGTLYEDVGDFDRAFEAYKEGNALKPRKYNREASERQFEALQQVFTRAFFERMPRSTLGSTRPIFIVGMPRSGTSLTEQILASHPEVHGAGELDQMGTIVYNLAETLDAKKGYPQSLSLLTEEIINAATQMYLDRIAEVDRHAPRVTDKMPQNFLHLGLIALLFPEIPIIHCSRDARDTCLSCYFQNFVAAGLSFAYDLQNLGHYYKLYDQLMKHWCEVLPIQVYESQYEDLVTDPETNVRRLLACCNLEWNDNCLNFYKNSRDTKTASYDQVRQPIYTKSVGRWRNYEKHLGPLFEALEGVETVDPEEYLGRVR